MSVSQLFIAPVASGHVLSEFHINPGLELAHAASIHNSALAMNRATGQLVIERGGEEMYRHNIMDVVLLAQPTPDLRFQELVDLFLT